MAEEKYTARDIEDIVKETIASQFAVKKEDVTLEKSLVNDLGADSLDTAELVMGLEEKFNLSIPDEELKKIGTVKDIVDYLTSRYGRSDIPY